MKTTECKICKYIAEQFTTAKIMDKYQINYFKCPHCGFIQTEEPIWLEEAYKESINITDTGILKRNQVLANFSTIIISLFFNKKNKFLDYAGGYGIFTRMMRDIGIDFYWDDKYSQNLLARGFEYNEKDTYELLTSFESFEHLTNPIESIENMLQISNNILLSTTLIPKKKPLADEWEYYGLEHGQHISFYSLETMEFIAKKYNLYFYTNRKNIHLFTVKKINNTLFRLLYILSRLGLSNIFKLCLKSKTLKDSAILKKTLRYEV